MADIVTRSGKGRPLTHDELDGNLVALNNDIQGRAQAVHGHQIADVAGLQQVIDVLAQPATQQQAGQMSAADKAKLDGLSGGGFAISGATDVTIDVPAVGQLLRYDGAKWANWTPNYLSGNQTVTLSGDATGSGATGITVTLSNSGVTAGTYKSVTVDAKGRVTAGTNPTTLAGYGITDAVSSTGNAASASKLQTARSIGMSGDVTWSIPSFDGSGNVTAAATLANTGVTAGSYGGASAVPVVTVDAKGRVTSITTAAISGGGGGGSFAISGATDAAITSPATGQLLRYDGAKWANWTPNYLSGNQTVTLSGDATGSGATGITVTLSNSGVTAGTYKSVTVDAKGRVTAGTNPTTLSGYGITDAASSTHNHAGVYQPTSADLSAIAGLAGVSGILKKTGAGTWALDTNAYLTGNQTVTVSGDATGSGATSINLTLANTGVTAGSYGSASAVPVITVDAKGRVAGVSTANIATGLSNFSEAKSSASPNVTVPVVSLSASGADANIDVAIVPKGTGAIAASIADGSAAGGDKRGNYAVDLQTYRTASSKVASGLYSVITGGGNNMASGVYSAVLGGSNNSATSNRAAVLGGSNNTVDGIDSCASGYYAKTLGRDIARSHANGSASAGYGAQYTDVLLQASTSSATSTVMQPQVKFSSTLPAAAHCRIRVVAMNTAAGLETKSWSGSALACIPSGGTITVYGISALTSDAGSSALSSASVSVSGDTTTNTLKINVVGVSGKSLLWIAHVEILENI